MVVYKIAAYFALASEGQVSENNHLWKLVLSFRYSPEENPKYWEDFYVVAENITKASEIVLKEAERLEYNSDWPTDSETMIISAELVAWYCLSNNE